MQSRSAKTSKDGSVARPHQLHRCQSRSGLHDGQDRLGQHRPNRGDGPAIALAASGSALISGGMMTISRRALGLLAGTALTLLALGSGDVARGVEPRMEARCLPVSQRTSSVGCWIKAQESLGPLPQTPIFWQLSTYPNLAAAEAAKSPGATVMEALDQVWLFTIGAAGARAPDGTSIAEIGPLPVKGGAEYTAQYMEAIFPPGAETRPHTHPGPEAWYHAARGVCLAPPDGKA